MAKDFIVEVPSDDLYISPNIWKGQLPAFLEEAVTTCSTPYQQDMLLLGTLSAVGYALPHMKFLYGGEDQRDYYPSLMTLIVAESGAGKGVLGNIKRLLTPIDNRMRACGKRVFISADSSAMAFAMQMKNNGDTGFMLAPEISHLTQAWKKDYGNYSELFRYSAEHEGFTLTRMRGNKPEDVDVENPRLSVVLSGTFDQVEPFVGDGANGLASRFLPYMMLEKTKFNSDVMQGNDHYKESGTKVVFERLGEELLARWEWLSAQDHDCLWSLTPEQASALGGLFEDVDTLAFDSKKYSRETGEQVEVPRVFSSYIRRVGENIHRIGLILSALRLPINATLPSIIYCSDEDFKTLVLLAEKLLRHSMEMVLMLSDKNGNGQKRAGNKPRQAEVSARRLLNELPEMFSTGVANEAGKRLGISVRTVGRYLQDLYKEGLIRKNAFGLYQKTNCPIDRLTELANEC